MPKGPSKSSAVIQRLLEERGQYEAWIVRLSAAEDATPDHVRERVKADYEARLKAVTEQLRGHETEVIDAWLKSHRTRAACGGKLPEGTSGRSRSG